MGGATLVAMLVSSLFAATAFVCADAVLYAATNNAIGTPGGNRFATEIGLPYSREVLAAASSFIWSTFRQQRPADGKSVGGVVSMVVESFNGVAYTAANDIHVSSDYVAKFSGDAKVEITGVLYHEMVHVWQWNGRGQAPGGLVEGVADYVRLKAGYAPDHWVKPGQGDRWDQGYDVTAHFLDYCSGLRDGFVADLNGKMKDGYSESFFVELMGKSVGQLWTDYKAKFGG